jgi:hypothetical protein
MLDRERLAKILALTTSTHDGEALSAIRRANEIIKGEGLSWELVLAQITMAQGVTIEVHRGNWGRPDEHVLFEVDGQPYLRRR